ncbi:MAG: helix-turn-helix domain-containing protein [Cyanobacteria bacterium P01_F01_bin.86]
MSETFQIYNSIAEFYAATGGHLEQAVDFTIHRLEELHPNTPYKSPLFRVNYYTIVLVGSGTGCYILDSHTFPTKLHTLYFTNPGHIKGFEMHEPVTGYIITFAESFLKQHVCENILDDFPFLIAEVVSPQYLTDPIFQVFENLFLQIIQEYDSQSIYKFKIIGNLMMVLLLKIKDFFWTDYNPLTEADSDTQIVRTFKYNLEAHYRALVTGMEDVLYQVQDYAAMQHLHPNYFSTVIKRKTGKTVNTWITEKTIAEAQALLARSSQSIQQIADTLGFKDASHFSRFFKKQTGTSPSIFRQQVEHS